MIWSDAPPSLDDRGVGLQVIDVPLQWLVWTIPQMAGEARPKTAGAVSAPYLRENAWLDKHRAEPTTFADG